MLSQQHHFLFIHIPKTGGNSIQNVLSPYSEDEIICKSPLQDGIERFELTNSQYPLSKHSTLSDYHLHLPASVIEQSLIFTCIRNPWDRMISYYFSPHRQVTAWSRPEFIQMLDHVPSSKSYLTLKSGAIGENIEFMRFERLVDDFRKICQKLSIPLPSMPHRNRSEHRQYHQYYDDELIDLVAAKAQFEITHFGYGFKD